MFDTLWNWAVIQLQTNEFFSGAALAGVIGSCAYYLKAVPINIWNRIERFIYFQVTVEQNSPLHRYIDLYLEHHYQSSIRKAEGYASQKLDITLTQENDWFRIWKKGRPITISKKKEKLENANEVESRFSRSYLISGILAKTTIINWLKEVRLWSLAYEESINERSRAIHLLGVNWEGEIRISKHFIRGKSFDQIFMREKKIVENDLNKFLGRKEFYESLGIAFKRGYCFHGKPGNGKSSLAYAIAQKLKYNLLLIDLTTISDLGKIFSRIDSGTVVVLEDVDKVFKGDQPVNPELKLSYSNLLNALSGVVQTSEIITIITTNYIQDLDPALLRAGRCDKVIEIHNPDDEVINEFLSKFYRAEVNESGYKDLCFAAVQDIVMTSETLEEAIKQLKDE